MWTAALLATSLLVADAQLKPPAPSTYTLQVSTPTQFADGVVRGASGSFGPLRIGQATVLYVFSGKTMCESSSPVATAPGDAGFGWRLDVTPMREANGALVMQVAWQRMWERGTKLTNGSRGRADVTLKPGGKLMFDFLGAGETTAACDAIGMGLEVGLASTANQGPLVETELWLVRKQMDGTETTQRQVVRQRVGEPPVPFYFDDVKIGEPPNQVGFKASGTLAIKEIVDGKMRLSVMLAQSSPDSDKWLTIHRSGTAEIIVAAPGDVVSLPLPAVWVTRSVPKPSAASAKDAKPAATPSDVHWTVTKNETFSVRLRSQIVK
jgi:hypothetical protein